MQVSFRFWVKRRMYWFYNSVCFFFFRMYVNTFSGRNPGRKVSSSNFIDRKSYQDGTLGGRFSNFSIVFPSVRENYRKTDKKREKCRNRDFRKIYFRFLAITPSIIELETWKFFWQLKMVTRIPNKIFKNIKPFLS